MLTACESQREEISSRDNETIVESVVISTTTQCVENYQTEALPETEDMPVISEDVSISNDTESLDNWLKNYLWDILGCSYLLNIPEVCDYINPRSAKLMVADIDDDGNLELIHSLFTGSYTIVNSVYKLKDSKLHFYGYYYGSSNIGSPNLLDGVYYDGYNERHICSRYSTSGGIGQPYWIQIYEMQFDDCITLVPIITSEWMVLSANDEHCFIKAEFASGNSINNENEYKHWFSQYLGDYERVRNIENISDSIDVPFSIGFKGITSEQEVQEIIDWICVKLKTQ